MLLKTKKTEQNYQNLHNGMQIVDWKVRKTERMSLIWYQCGRKWQNLNQTVKNTSNHIPTDVYFIIKIL